MDFQKAASSPAGLTPEAAGPQGGAESQPQGPQVSRGPRPRRVSLRQGLYALTSACLGFLTQRVGPQRSLQPQRVARGLLVGARLVLCGPEQVLSKRSHDCPSRAILKELVV